MEEFINKSYYDSSSKKFIDIHRSHQASIEWFIAKLLFKDDLKRVVYGTQDNIFRKRIESLDTGKNDTAPLKRESLDLPFAGYFQSGDVEPDDRPAAVNAGQAVDGIYYPDEDRTMRSLAVMYHYKVICFFESLENVRIAQQLLFWEKEPKSPIWLYSNVVWRNTVISVPTNLTIESITTHPDYKETDWLIKNRIFPVEIDITIRSYQLLINNVDKIIQLPIRFANYKDLYEEDEESSSIITEEVVLNWAAQKFDLNMNPDDVDTEKEDYKLYSPLFVEKELTVPEVAESCVKVPNEYTTDVIRGYWQTDTSCVLNAYMYDELKSTPEKARIAFRVKPSTFKYFDRLTLYIPTKEKVTVTDCHATEAYIDGLYPNSEYKLTLSLHALDGTIANYFIKFKTKNSESNEAPQPEKINKVNGLVGMQI